MKSFNYRFLILFSSLLLLTNCKEDVYDPGKVRPIPPAENPFGEDFIAPAKFGWNLSTTYNLTIEIKDLYKSNYNYLIEIFPKNPIEYTGTDNAPISVGYANGTKNFTSKITLPNSVETIYLRQTDPGARVTYHEYTLSPNKPNIYAKLFIEDPMETRLGNHGNSGWDNEGVESMTVQDCTPTDISSMSTTSVPKDNKLDAGSVFVIESGTTYSKGLQCLLTPQATVVVKGTWKVPDKFKLSGLNIYVAKGGMLTTPTSKDELYIGSNCQVEVQEEGLLSCHHLEIKNEASVKVFGTLKAQEDIDVEWNSLLHVHQHGTIQAENIDLETKSALYNFGNIQLSDDLEGEDHSTIYNEGEITVADEIELESCIVHNKGRITADEIGADDDDDRHFDKRNIIINYETGVIITNEFEENGIVINDNLIEAEEFDYENAFNSHLYNNCLIIIKEEMKVHRLTMTHGCIIGKQNGPNIKDWSPVPEIKFGKGATIYLNEGSFLRTDKIECTAGMVIDGGKTSPSMIMANTITYYPIGLELTRTKIRGNILLNVNKEEHVRLCQKDNSVITGNNLSFTNPIENCAGIMYEPDEGETPTTPEGPEEIHVLESMYTYAFEDLWPVYGDYDMNDLILTLDDIELKLKDNKVQQANFSMRLKAIGAGRNIGLGLQFISLESIDKILLNGENVTLEDLNRHPTLIITKDGHRLMVPDMGENVHINTDPAGLSTNEIPLHLTLEFHKDGPGMSSFNLADLDFFIFSMKSSNRKYRREIHLPYYAPTSWADQSYSSAANDNGKGEFKSHENLVWAIRIPGEWQWPQEKIEISKAYPDFKSWVISGGSESKNWTENKETGFIY